MLMPVSTIWITILIVCAGSQGADSRIINLKMPLKFLKDHSRLAEDANNRLIVAKWNFMTNVTDSNRKLLVKEKLMKAKFDQTEAKFAQRFNLSTVRYLMRRQFMGILDIGVAAQTDVQKLARLHEVESEIETIYSKAKVCFSSKECLPLEPDLTRLMATSRDYDRLLMAWESWRNGSGGKIKTLFSELVALSNEALKLQGYQDTGAYWRSWYDIPGFESDINSFFNQIKPLYEQLHAYVRRQLVAVYGKDKFPTTGHIPAHLLGDMWAQEWSSLADALTPFKNRSKVNMTSEMLLKGFTPLKIFQTADEFFTSLGMIPVPETFWTKSMLEKPEDRDVMCQASAWDFYNKVDFRILHCTDVTQKDLMIAHHEMGHIQYFLQYRNLPVVFRQGANPGFHEAVGDVIALSVQTQQHKASLGLSEGIVDESNETDINFLMNMALQKIAFLPFGYLIDQWRWSVFRGDTKPEQYNKNWWDLRCKYQGVSPPIVRSSSDFDPGSKFHVAANVPYIRYFVSTVIQFQFQKALCDDSGYKGPLHKCDIYKSKVAGKRLSKMLKLGSSKPWTKAMKMLTGKSTIDTKPLLEYFQPLLEFLRKENGQDYGWTSDCPASMISDDINTEKETGPNSEGTKCCASIFYFLFVLTFVFLLC